MRSFKITSFYRIILLIIIPLFLFLSSSLSVKSSLAATCPPYCPAGYACNSSTGGHCLALCYIQGNFCHTGGCTATSHSVGTCPNGETCCATNPVTTCVSQGGGCKSVFDCSAQGGSNIGAVNCVSPNICCVPPGGGGGGGGGTVPPPGTYQVCIPHLSNCFQNIGVNGLSCCDPKDTCMQERSERQTYYICDNVGGLPPANNCTGSQCQTAIGNVSTSPEGFVQKIFTVILSLSGAIALILIIISGYRLMASQGNPEQVQKAREQLTAAIIGLLFVIFSLVLLQSIGVDILHLPGFSQ